MRSIANCQGLKPAGHHLTNILFHVVNTLLLFGLLHGMTKTVWRSALVAALFAWHPMHVESVAWVAERKDVLSTFFGLLNMLAYWRYASESKVQSPRAKVFYGLALVCFALGLMSKPMLVTLPFVLLLLDIWPLGRIYDLRFTNDDLKTGGAGLLSPGRLAREKIPFFALAFASSVVTFLVQHAGGAVSTLVAIPLHLRLANAVISYQSYLMKLLWPIRLSIHYPYALTSSAFTFAEASLLIITISAIVVYLRHTRPYLAMGWFWFLGMLIPVIGLVQVGSQAMADRYSYLPAVGLFISVAWGLAAASNSWPALRIPLLALILWALAGCLYGTIRQERYWENSTTIFTRAIAVNPDDAVVLVNAGSSLIAQGQVEQGLNYARQALKLKTNDAGAECVLGLGLSQEKKLAEAANHYRAALRLDPDQPEALNNLAWILAASSDKNLRNGEEAVVLGERACALTHYERPTVIGTLAAAYAEAGRFKEAIEAGEKARQLALASGDSDLAATNQKLIDLYRAGQAYHDE